MAFRFKEVMCRMRVAVLIGQSCYSQTLSDPKWQNLGRGLKAFYPTINLLTSFATSFVPAGESHLECGKKLEMWTPSACYKFGL